MNVTTSTSTTQPTITQVPPLLPWVSDSMLMVFAPVVVYWIHSMFFHIIDSYNLLEKYRLHTPAELLKRNHVGMGEVLRDVLIQQVVQCIVGYILSFSEGIDITGHEAWEVAKMLEGFKNLEQMVLPALAVLGVDGWTLGEKLSAAGWDWRLKTVEFVYWIAIPFARLWLAIFLLDTWQYFLHRLMHTVPWLYRTFHSRHHRLYVPYAFGALYNHPFEGLLMDTIGAGLAFKVAGLTQRQGAFFFSFSSMKTVDDHCGYKIPWDPLQIFFWNNAAYHDIHHQGWGIKTNFSQPFFICWDRWLNTQWTGEITSRYAKSRAVAERLVAADLASHNPSSTNIPLTKEESKRAFPYDRYSDDDEEFAIVGGTGGNAGDISPTGSVSSVSSSSSGSGSAKGKGVGVGVGVVGGQVLENVASSVGDVKRRLIPEADR